MTCSIRIVPLVRWTVKPRITREGYGTYGEQCLRPMDRPGRVYLPGDQVESQAMTGVGAPAEKAQPDAHRSPWHGSAREGDGQVGEGEEEGLMLVRRAAWLAHTTPGRYSPRSEPSLVRRSSSSANSVRRSPPANPYQTGGGYASGQPTPLPRQPNPRASPPVTRAGCVFLAQCRQEPQNAASGQSPRRRAWAGTRGRAPPAHAPTAGAG
jgi:hypothetical protein